MSPDFTKQTIETIAKRSAFRCSNPDCRVLTVGPNSTDTTATIIGEAAHIHGARPKSKRYVTTMNDEARAEITNAIWLCRNCHAKIDRDENYFTAELLFRWLEIHERYIASELGSVSDKTRFELEERELQSFSNYPAIIRRIVIDKPRGWEWRLTAELMRHLNGPELQRLKDLREGLYTRPLLHLHDDNIFRWIDEKFAEISNSITPIEPLLASLTEAWGMPGKSGNLNDIHRLCRYIRDYMSRIIDIEESLYFVNPPEEFENLIALIRSAFGENLAKFQEIPNTLDEVLSMLDKNHATKTKDPLVIRKTISFSLPDGWLDSINAEIQKSSEKFILRCQAETNEDFFGHN